MARPTKQFLTAIDQYARLSGDELKALSTSEILSFFALISLMDPEDEATITLVNAAYTNLSEEIDQRIPPRTS